MPDRQSTMNISMPASMRAFIRRRMKEAGFGNTSEYVRHLVRQDQRASAQYRLDELLREGLESGPAVKVTPKFWDDLYRRVEARAAELRKARRAG